MQFLINLTKNGIIFEATTVHAYEQLEHGQQQQSRQAIPERHGQPIGQPEQQRQQYSEQSATNGHHAQSALAVALAAPLRATTVQLHDTLVAEAHAAPSRQPRLARQLP